MSGGVNVSRAILFAVTIHAGLVWVPAHAAVTPPWDPVFATGTAADFGLTTRPFGVAAGDFDGDDVVDLVIGLVSGQTSFAAGGGLPWEGANARMTTPTIVAAPQKPRRVKPGPRKQLISTPALMYLPDDIAELVRGNSPNTTVAEPAAEGL